MVRLKHNTLLCVGTGLRSGRGFPVFECTVGEVVTLDRLCDGNADCGAGDDETSPLCESETMQATNFHFNFSVCLSTDKCRLPYYGGCVFTRECLSGALDVGCPRCLNGFVENPSDPSGECLGEFSLVLLIYNVEIY